MKQKLLVICGPTASGKTKLALHLAKKFDGELVSADSRQVYKKMDIGTGKDLPPGAKVQSSNLKILGKMIRFYVVKGIKVWGYDLVGPKEAFSAGQYLKVARKIIKDIRKRGKLPILVGGTGLYIKVIVDGLGTAGVGADRELRVGLAQKSVPELQEILRGQDPVKLASMNNSDINNPLRLLRAIEIAQSAQTKEVVKHRYDVLFVGLMPDKNKLFANIQTRVEKRIIEGQEREVRELLDQGVDWDMQSMSSIGYREWQNYFKGRVDLEELKKQWIKAEKQYVKKQLTWFKRDRRINWLDPGKRGFLKEVEEMVKKWHN